MGCDLISLAASTPRSPAKASSMCLNSLDIPPRSIMIFISKFSSSLFPPTNNPVKSRCDAAHKLLTQPGIATLERKSRLTFMHRKNIASVLAAALVFLIHSNRIWLKIPRYYGLAGPLEADHRDLVKTWCARSTALPRRRGATPRRFRLVGLAALPRSECEVDPVRADTRREWTTTRR